ncbi:MAG: hypothetical protein RIQ44_386 [Actinomycetota bacterium]
MSNRRFLGGGFKGFAATRFRVASARVRFAVAALLGVSLVTGCAEIPTASSVKQGPDIQSGLSSDYLYYSPSGPVLGESKADILAGFLNASTGPQNDYGVAREYLTPEFKTKWSPNDRVYIQRGSQKVVIDADGQATVSIGVSAVVDAQGHYTAKSANASQTLKFKLTQFNGEWRISEAPNAVVMIRPVFDVIFRSYSVYFFDRTYSYLIPDLRWFPARASTATRLANAILLGPSAWLAKAVSPAMPSGTELLIDAVTVLKETAVVNLSSQALQATKLQKQRFKAELFATLTQVGGVEKVKIQIDSADQKIEDFSPASTSSGAFAPVVLAAGQLQQLIGPSGSRLANASAWVKTVQAKDFAVTADETSVALVGSSGVYLGRLDQSTESPKLVDTRSRLLSPRFDRRGQLWLMGTDGTLQIVTQTGKPVWQTLPWLKDHRVRAFAISPEGARLALVVQDAKKVLRLHLVSVIRNTLGAVTGFGDPIELSYGVGSPRAIEWAGKTNLMVLSTVTASQSNLSMLTVGGEPREIGSIDPAIGLMVSDDGSNIYVLDSLHRLKEYRGYTWTYLDQDVTAAHMVN